MSPAEVMARLAPVAAGGAMGSLARWGLLQAAGDRYQDLTLLALNVAGSLLVGVLIGHRIAPDDRRYGLIGTGFAGGLTTFSTFAVAVARRLDEGALLAAAGNTVGTVLLAVLAAGIGYRLGSVSLHRRNLRALAATTDGPGR